MTVARPYATPLPTRSTRTAARSPGTTPDTRITWPFERAIIQPPAAGFSMRSDSVSPGFIFRSGEGHRRQIEALANELVERSLMRPLSRIRRHLLSDGSQHRSRVLTHRLEVDRTDMAPRDSEQRAVGCGQPLAHGPSSLASEPARHTRTIEL